jgi:DNA-binding response OmpR family regulator/two-component sensor histidine kinase
MSNGLTDAVNSEILIVDDTVANIDILTNFLEKEGYDISFAKSGSKALEVANSNTPDLVLLDVMLPDMDGYETCRQLKELEAMQEVPVIFVTSKYEAEDIVAGFKAGGVDFVSKPFHYQEVRARVQTHIQKKEYNKSKQEQFVQAEKLFYLAEMVAGFGHEISTPIGISITAVSELEKQIKILHDSFTSKKLTKSDFERGINISGEAVDIARNNLNRAKGFIQSFKRIAVDQCSEQASTFFIKEYLSDIILSLRPKLKKTKIKIEILSDDDFAIKNYPGAFSQVIINLIMNSLIHAYELEDEGTIVFKITHVDGNLCLVYKDDGKGMDEDTISRIYEKYFTTKKERGGSGLGLYIVHTIVTETMKGNINCKSTLGEGTEFIMNLPINIIDDSDTVELEG